MYVSSSGHKQTTHARLAGTIETVEYPHARPRHHQPRPSVTTHSTMCYVCVCSKLCIPIICTAPYFKTWRRRRFFEVRVSHNIVFTMALLDIGIALGHVTLKVGSACLLVRQQGSARFPPFMDAFTESLISEKNSTLTLYLPVCH